VLSGIVVVAASNVFLLARTAPESVATSSSSPKPSPAPSFPPAWDGRVAPLAAFVEEKRGLKFKHPVFVDFLTAEQYTKQVTGEEFTKEDRDEIKQVEGLSRSLGLINPETDLAKEAETLADEGTLAFYATDDKRVHVRGTEMTPTLRMTVVHELTHALQDQHYDLSRADRSKTSGEELAFTGLIEGDAIRIENEYYDSLPESEAKQIEAGDVGGGEEVSEVPPGLLALTSAGHALGEYFVDFLVASSGPTAVDAAFKQPPTTEEHLFDPFTFLDSQPPRSVQAQKLAQGERRIDAGDFGAVTWYVFLALRLDPHLAMAAADGWGGDSFVAFEREKKSCIRANFIGDTPADSDEMVAALDAWVKLMPPNTGSVTRDADTVTFSACDPGKIALPETRKDADILLALPLARASMAAETIREGVPRDIARCASRRVAEAFSLEELSDPDYAGSSKAQARITELVERCVY
jgi:hypothetical protein